MAFSKRDVKRMLIHARIDELKRHHHRQNYPGNPMFWIECKDVMRGNTCGLCQRIKQLEEQLEELQASDELRFSAREAQR